MGLFSGITNILTGGMGASGKANAGVNSAANAWLQSLYEKTGAQEQPFIQSGTTANKTLTDILTGGDTSAMEPFFNSSVYQFPLQQGLQQINNSNAAKGLSNSTAALRNTGQFTEGLASQNFQQFIQNLMGLTGTAQQGIGTQVGAGTGVANAVGNVAGNQGQAAGQSSAAPWAAIGQGVGLLSSIFSDINLKENLVPAGQENGHNVYIFNYKGEPQKYIGIIAQEVEKTNPDAVIDTPKGKMVDYAKIGVNFRRVN